MDNSKTQKEESQKARAERLLRAERTLLPPPRPDRPESILRERSLAEAIGDGGTAARDGGMAVRLLAHALIDAVLPPGVLLPPAGGPPGALAITGLRATRSAPDLDEPDGIRIDATLHGPAPAGANPVDITVQILPPDAGAAIRRARKEARPADRPAGGPPGAVAIALCGFEPGEPLEDGTFVRRTAAAPGVELLLVHLPAARRLLEDAKPEARP